MSAGNEPAVFVRRGRTLYFLGASRIERHWLRRALLLATLPLMMAWTVLSWAWFAVKAVVLLPLLVLLGTMRDWVISIDSMCNRWNKPYREGDPLPDIRGDAEAYKVDVAELERGWK